MKENALESYKLHIRKNFLFLLLLVGLLLLTVAVSLSMGAYNISLSHTIRTILGRSDVSSNRIVIWNIRMPRVLGAVTAGAALSVSGAVMQSILKNPMASPFTLGISSASAFGAAVGILYLGAGTALGFISVVALSAFLCAASVTAVILAIARIRGTSPEVMILSGIAMGTMFSAGFMALQYFADDVELSRVVFWTFGDLGRVGWKGLAAMVLLSTLATIYFIVNAWNYNALRVGDESAMALGVNVSRVRVTSLTIASLVTAVVVAFVGIIGFVGLVVPHMVRKIIGSDDRWVLPASVVLGALLLLVSDTVARMVLSPVVLPVGILTSFLGGPMFLYLVIRRNKT